MTDAERELLIKIAGEGGYTLLTEYTPEADWHTASALIKRGFITAKSLLTGTAGITLTEAGRAAVGADKSDRG